MAKSRHVFAEKGNSSTSIFTIARNLSIDRRRRERVFQRLPVWRSEKASDEDPADVTREREERYAASCEALKTLPPEQLGITALSNLDGLSHGEVADE